MDYRPPISSGAWRGLRVMLLCYGVLAVCGVLAYRACTGAL